MPMRTQFSISGARTYVTEPVPTMRRDSVGSNGSNGLGAQRPGLPRRTSSSLAVEQEQSLARYGRKASINSIGSNYTRPAAGTEVTGMPPLQLPLENFTIGHGHIGGRRRRPPMQSRGPSTSSLSSRSSAGSLGGQDVSRGAW